jgi:hypothetical protein
MKASTLVLGLATLALLPSLGLAQAGTAATTEQLNAVRAELEALKDKVNEPEGSIQTTIMDVAKLKKISLSGYAQLRLQYDQAGTNSATAGDKRLNFSQRRVRLKVTGRPTDNTQVTYQFDMGDKGFTTKDAVIDYFLKGEPTVGPSIGIGQFAVPFGYQNTQSSSAVETGERAKIIRELFPDEYDRGIRFSTATDGLLVLDGAVLNGTGQNTDDTTENKDLVARLRWKVLPNLDAGLTGYWGGKQFVANSNPANPGTVYAEKERQGIDFQYYLQGMSLKAEAVTAKDRGVDKSGYYALLSTSLTARDMAAVRYAVYDQRGVATGKQKMYSLGFDHFLDASTKLRLAHEINSEHKNGVSNNVTRVEVLSTF